MSPGEPEKPTGNPAPAADPPESSAVAVGSAHLSGIDATLRHALRTPLNHIIGYSELLLEEAEGSGFESMREDLHHIHAAGKELLALINDLFDPRAVESDESPPADSGTTPVRDSSLPEKTVPRDHSGAMHDAPAARILVVDDNANNREIVARLLAREGFEVITAENGAEALERPIDGHIDLVLLDVMMPVMDGIETCRRLKENPETRLTPVVIMTALGQVEDRVRGIRAGADDFLTKPVNRQELLARIQTSLRLKHTVDDKLDRLRGTQEYLARFVPQSVIRQIKENPDAPALEKTDQDISAMFVDVSGYTRLSESMRQTADFMIEKYFSRYLDVIHIRSGDVTETSGDGMMVVFAADDPVEHAVNAATAALDILSRTEELNAQLTGIFDPIAVHIGINSGIALIGPTKYEGASGARWTYTALGPAVNLAARIAGVAEGGMICAGPETARRIGDRFEVHEIGKRELKNVRDEVMIWRVAGTLT